MGVLLDIQGVQSRAHGERGIARYLLELASALRRTQPGVVERFLLNPHLSVPASLDPLVAEGCIGYVDGELPDATTYHVGSPFEPVPIDRLWPARARRSMRLAVTLYDLIPDLMPQLYLDDPVSRRHYYARLDLVREADLVLAISEATAADAVERLGLRPDRIHVVGAAPSPRFQPPDDPRAALRLAQEALPWLRPGFLLYTGAADPRKNLERLIEAYAVLEPELRARHQLVVVVSGLPAEREQRLQQVVAAAGASGDLRLTRFVADDTLALLYQSCELFVFPSLYEGFGLPIAEARACGAPVVAARTSAIVELVRDPRALFDPRDPGDIARVVTRCLTDRALLEELRASPLEPRFRWPAVAARVADAYGAVAPRTRAHRRRRPRIAYVSPLPPQRSGVATYSHRLLAELVARVDVDAFVDVDPAEVEGPLGVHIAGLVALDLCERARGGYDEIVYCLGNDSHHANVLPVLRLKPGAVVAHDVRLTSLYAPRDVEGYVSVETDERCGATSAREAVELSSRFLVHSEYAAELARLDVTPEQARKVEVLPFGFPRPARETGSRTQPPVVASFGDLTRFGMPATILRAFASVADRLPRARLVFVGPEAEAGVCAALADQAETLGVRDRVTFTGRVPDDEWRRRLENVSAAIQLRSVSIGESPGAVAECLAAGVPVITNELGWTRELPGETVVKVRSPVAEEELSGAILDLLRDDRRRAALAAAGREHARENSFASAADALLRALQLAQ